jgi:hypothetical protein
MDRPESNVTPLAATVTPEPPAFGRYYAAALIAAVAGLVVGTVISAYNGQPKAIELKTDVSIFAFFYIAAQGIERVVEMIVLGVDYLFSKRNPDNAFASTKKSRALASARGMRRRMAHADLVSRNAAEDLGSMHTKLMSAEDVAEKSRNAVLVLTLGMGFGLSFVLLASVEMGLFGLVLSPRGDNAAVPLWVDWVLTAAALTGGAKGLHDLLSKVQTSKEADEAA